MFGVDRTCSCICQRQVRSRVSNVAHPHLRSGSGEGPFCGWAVTEPGQNPAPQQRAEAPGVGYLMVHLCAACCGLDLCPASSFLGPMSQTDRGREGGYTNMSG